MKDEFDSLLESLNQEPVENLLDHYDPMIFMQ